MCTRLAPHAGPRTWSTHCAHLSQSITCTTCMGPIHYPPHMLHPPRLQRLLWLVWDCMACGTHSDWLKVGTMCSESPGLTGAVIASDIIPDNPEQAPHPLDLVCGGGRVPGADLTNMAISVPFFGPMDQSCTTHPAYGATWIWYPYFKTNKLAYCKPLHLLIVIYCLTELMTVMSILNRNSKVKKWTKIEMGKGIKAGIMRVLLGMWRSLAEVRTVSKNLRLNNLPVFLAMVC